MGYLEDLTIRLARGAAELPEDLKALHGQWILNRQEPSGGWGGREGGADLYYTSFAARTLMILGLLDGPPADRLANYFRSQLSARVGIVDLISLLMGIRVLEMSSGIDLFKEVDQQWRQSVTRLLESFRRPEGGYAKTLEGHAGSTYQTFLTLLAYQLMELPIPEPESIVDFIRRHEHDQGGYLEIRVGKRAGVNPTAAAIGSLRILNAMDPQNAQRCAEFLDELQSDEGGWAANTRIPLADVLSTFTAVVTLIDLNAAQKLPWRVEQYVLSMARSTGGWAGFALDPAEDVEYTFYGLGTLSLIADHRNS